MSRSKWNHSICGACWNKKNPGRPAVAIREEFRDEKPVKCCYCGKGHGSGIFVREAPENVACRGVHPEEEEACPI